MWKRLQVKAGQQHQMGASRGKGQGLSGTAAVLETFFNQYVYFIVP